MEINYENFGQEDFTFPGMYRAIVEDNEDPKDIGRVRVRIFGIHSFDEEETPTEHLPWAEQCLSLYFSGGKNKCCKQDKPKQGERYRPTDRSENQTLLRNEPNLEEEIKDLTTDATGTGGIFTVPAKGNNVWIFFENGDHTRPQYFAGAPKSIDWGNQREEINGRITKKREDINKIRKEFDKVVDKKEHKGKNEPVESALLKEINEKPKLNIFDLNSESKIPNHQITSYTSPAGVTHIITHVKGTERHYLIHKGNIEYTDHNGQCKRVIGTKKDDDQDSESPNDFQEAITNNYELHIGGDFETHILKSKSVQIDGDMQVNVGKNVSCVSRDGNVNIIVENGDCNLSTTGKINAYAGDNLQINTDGDALVNIGNNAIINANENIDFKAGGNITFEAGGTLNFKGGGVAAFECSSFSFTGSSMDVSCGAGLKVDGTGIGTTGICEASSFKGVHPGLKVVGDARLINDVPSPKSASASPPSAAAAVSFESGNPTELQDPNPPAFTDPDE